MVAATLAPYSETKFDRPAPPGLPVSSPTVDLSATWDSGAGAVLVCRPGDEVVSRIQAGGRRGDAGVTAVKWKPDGQFISAAWNDGVVRLMGLENNKAAHSIRVLEGGKAVISHVAWTSNSVSKQARKDPGSRSNWQTILGKEAAVPDLPREIMFLEVDTALPKISPLPSASAGSGEDAMVFTLRTGIDFLFQPFKPEDSEEVSVMVVGTDAGDVHLSIYDSLTIGNFKYQSPRDASNLRLVQHASHRDVSTHTLLFRPADPHALEIVPMDLSFAVSSPINLSLLASKLTTLQKLQRYVRQCFLHMQVEYKNTRELPSRFLASIQEDLEHSENGPRDIVAALYHTLVTGHTYEPVREWLVDSLAERGHKRWDKAVTTSLTALRSLTHQNLLPALDRTSLMLSRLRGLAEFHDTRDDTGLSPPQLSRLADTVSALSLAAHHVLTTVTEELELFGSFSAWLRLQIDRLATGSGEELAEKEAGLNAGHVLTYIRRYLAASPLAAFLDGTGEGDWEEVGRGASLLETVDAQLKRRDAGQPYAEFLAKLGWLVGDLEAKADVVFEDASRAQRRGVRFGDETRIVLEGEIDRVEACMDAVYRDGAINGLTYTALTAKDRPNEIFLYRTSIPIVNGISSAPETHSCAPSLSDTQIIDVGFLTPSLLLALVIKDSNPSILTLPLSIPLPWAPHTGPQPPPTALDPSSISLTPIPRSDGFTPVQMNVQDRSEVRGPLPARVCLLGKDHRTYSVFEFEVKE